MKGLKIYLLLFIFSSATTFAQEGLYEVIEVRGKVVCLNKGIDVSPNKYLIGTDSLQIGDSSFIRFIDGERFIYTEKEKSIKQVKEIVSASSMNILSIIKEVFKKSSANKPDFKVERGGVVRETGVESIGMKFELINGNTDLIIKRLRVLAHTPYYFNIGTNCLDTVYCVIIREDLDKHTFTLLFNQPINANTPYCIKELSYDMPCNTSYRFHQFLFEKQYKEDCIIPLLRKQAMKEDENVIIYKTKEINSKP